jgi:glycyl-tRNA synthetase
LQDKGGDGAAEHTEHVNIEVEAGKEHNLGNKVCPSCGAVGQFNKPMAFRLMFETQMGANADDTMTLFLRPETAQGIFANFRNVLDSSRVKIPFGIAQIGKSFRNEVTTKAFIFRTREFEQAELEFICKPGTDDNWYNHWKEQRFNWYLNLGIKKENLRFRDHDPDELAHYAKACVDVEYKFPFGSGDWQELEGIANRTDYDLRQHQRGMRTMNDWFEQKGDLARLRCGTRRTIISRGRWRILRKRRGSDMWRMSSSRRRAWIAARWRSWWMRTMRRVNGEVRNVLRFHPQLAPIKAAIFPLVKKDGLPEIGMKLYNDLKKYFNCFYDERARWAVGIGGRMRRNAVLPDD